MAARVSTHRRWMLRDIPRTYVLLIWLAFKGSHFLMADDGGYILETINNEFVNPAIQRDGRAQQLV
jgi:hypothetical protein